MSRILTRLRNVKAEDIQHILKHESEPTTKEDIALSELWQFENPSSEVLSLFCDYIRKKKTNPDVQFKTSEENLDQVYSTNFYKPQWK
jgi:hypothetical protein